MRFAASTLALLAILANPTHGDIWINEFHYDDDDAHASFSFDFVELAISPDATSIPLSDIAITFYNGLGTPYLTRTADTILVSPVYTSPQAMGWRFASNFGQGDDLIDGLGGFALSVSGALVPGQFLSYGGSFTATSGVANGLTSTDVGFTQNDLTDEGATIALIGLGETYGDFIWSLNSNTHTGPNIGQTFGEPSSLPRAVPEASQLLLFGALAVVGGTAAAYRRWRR